MTPPSLECRDAGVSLDGALGPTTILDHVDLVVEQGAFVSILGLSGSGKTTLLRLLGGLQEASSGQVLANGRPVDGPPDGVVTVFQDYTNSLLPWRTVARNVALGIESGTDRATCRDQVDRALAMVGLQDHAAARPRELSGGMQQRVQIARAVAMQASVMLMDEPFGALDAMTKASLQDQLQQLQAETGTTVVFVTHDVEEAVYLSDRIVVLSGRPGRIGCELDVDLPRPRTQIATREHADYLELRRLVYRALGDG